MKQPKNYNYAITNVDDDFKYEKSKIIFIYTEFFIYIL